MTVDEANTVHVEQVWVPDNLDGPDAKDFLDAVEVGRRVRMQTWGSDDLAYSPLEKLLEFSDPYERQIILVAKVDGEIVGTVDIALPLADNMDLAEFTLDILPEFQRQGVGRQLLEAAEELARAEGRTTLNNSVPASCRSTPSSWLTFRRRRKKPTPGATHCTTGRTDARSPGWKL